MPKQPNTSQDNGEILKILHKWGQELSPIPKDLAAKNEAGEAYAMAYPIQGLLKYHGLSDFEHRIANFSSISVNNSAAFTITYVKFDPQLTANKFIFNGEPLDLSAGEYARFNHQLGYIKKFTNISTKAFIATRNVMANDHSIAKAKGLGFSASGGAAMAHAIMAVAYGDQSDQVKNPQLRSIFARYMAGSATRSTVGGIGLWLSHANDDPFENYAIRLDRPVNDTKFIRDIALITVPLSSKVKTDQAHKTAPLSPFYPAWQANRQGHVKEMITAIYNHNFELIGDLTEYDTLCLHAVTMTGSRDKNLLLWAPESIIVMQTAREIRQKHIPVYFNIDTGPSVVLMTVQKHRETVLKALKERLPSEITAKIVLGGIAGESHLLEATNEEAKLLQEEIEHYGK